MKPKWEPKIPKESRCPKCKGSGLVPDKKIKHVFEPCPKCNGTGIKSN